MNRCPECRCPFHDPAPYGRCCVCEARVEEIVAKTAWTRRLRREARKAQLKKMLGNALFDRLASMAGSIIANYIVGPAPEGVDL